MKIYKSNIQWIYTYSNIYEWERFKELEEGEGGGSKQRQCLWSVFPLFLFWNQYYGCCS